jgi:hypothetical protein
MTRPARPGLFGLLAISALGALALAAPSAAKSPEAAFKLLSASGTHAHTFHERETDIVYYGEDGHALPGPTRADICAGSQSENVSYRTTKPTKMYVFVRKAHGLHTLVSDKPEPDGGLDYLSTPGQMTLSRSVSYEATRGCGEDPVDCPETTFTVPIDVSGTHDPQGGIEALYRVFPELPPGLDRTCSPFPGPHHGPLSPHAVEPDQPEFPGAIPRSDLFNEKKKRLSGDDTVEFSYETTTEPGYSYETTVAGTYRETIAVELKRLKRR